MRTARPERSTAEGKSGAASEIRPGMPAGPATAALLERYGPRLRGLSLRLCGNAADADDMVQEVFLQAFRKWHTFRGDADAGTWLYAIAARSCKARARRKGGIDRRTPALSQLMPWDEATVTRAAAAVGAHGDESDAERREAVARVQAAVTLLPEHLRLPLVFKEVLEMSVEATAAALGLAANTVKTRVHRARLALRKAMTDGAARVAAAPPLYEKQVCLDLLKAKMAAMDRGAAAEGFAVPQAEVCARCRAVFRELDLVQDACARIGGDGTMPEALRHAILAAIAARDTSDRAAAASSAAPPRGRRPVRISARPPR